jgi:hypothetical protein
MTILLLKPALDAFVVIFGAYVLLKFSFFFTLSYKTRRKMLDASYAGRAYATDKVDVALLILSIAMAFGLLATGAEPIGFLGGLLVGGTLIQLYFHAFHAPVAHDREAPEPRSPLKIMSYAIQAEPRRPWMVLVVYSVLVLACIGLHWLR